jgi:hypothetical protein
MMFNLKRLATASLALVATLALFAPVAEAASPYVWTDLSSRLEVRKNRPVWSIAYAEPYWYFTDGIAFNQGGHVWRTDGQWTKDLTIDIKSKGLTRVDKIVGSGTTVYFLQNTSQVGSYLMVNLVPTTNTYSHLDTVTQSMVDAVNVGMRMPNTGLPNITGYAWDGKAWMILSNHKNIYRMENGSVVSLGRTRDYFTTIASNGKGTILLGGAVSNIDLSEPLNNPLMAKLVKVVDPSVVPVTSTQTNSQISSWTWTAPTVTSLSAFDKTTYNVGAWNANGISSIEIFANNKSLKTCAGTGATQNCSVDVIGSSFNASSTVVLNAKVIGKDGSMAWTSNTELKMTSSATTGSPTTAGDISLSNEFTPNVTSLSRYETTTFRATANAAKGLNRIEFWSNYQILNTCVYPNIMGTQVCEMNLKGTDYTMGTVLSLNARAIDSQGREVWGGTRTIVFKEANAPMTLNGLSWTWTIPEKTSFAANENASFRAGASDPDGIKLMEIYFDDKLVQSCVFQDGYGSRECGALFPTTVGTVKAKAKIYDILGNEAWTTEKSYQITEATASNSTSLTNTFALSSTGDEGYVWGQTITLTAAAHQLMGVNRIDIIWNNLLVKSCLDLTKNGSLTDVPVKGSVTIYNASTENYNFTQNTVLVSENGRRFLTTASVNLAPGKSALVPAMSDGVGQTYTLALGAKLAIPAVGSINSSLVYAQVADGFTGGREVVSSVPATCSFTTNAIEANQATYGTRMMDANGKVIWTGDKTIYKK